VRVRDEDQINRRKIADAQTRAPEPLQDEQPPGKVWIDHYVSATDLHEEAGVPDKGDPELSVSDEAWFMSLAAAGGDRRMPHQTRELSGAFAESRIPECLFDHPGSRARVGTTVFARCSMLVVLMGASE